MLRILEVWGGIRDLGQFGTSASVVQWVQALLAAWYALLTNQRPAGIETPC